MRGGSGKQILDEREWQSFIGDGTISTKCSPAEETDKPAGREWHSGGLRSRLSIDCQKRACCWEFGALINYEIPTPRVSTRKKARSDHGGQTVEQGPVGGV